MISALKIFPLLFFIALGFLTGIFFLIGFWSESSTLLYVVSGLGWMLFFVVTLFAFSFLAPCCFLLVSFDAMSNKRWTMRTALLVLSYLIIAIIGWNMWGFDQNEMEMRLKEMKWK